LSSARAHLDASIALYDPERPRARPFSYSVADPGVAALSYGALTLWLLGYPEQALRKSQAALTLADSLLHPFSQGLALSFAAILHQLRRENSAVREKTAGAVTLAREQAFSQWLALGEILHCWALTAQGPASAGVVTQLRRALAAYRGTGAELGGPYFFALLAEAYGRVGQADEGLNVLAEVLALPDRSLEYEAELHRLKGELTLRRSGVRSPGSEVEEGSTFKARGSQSEHANSQSPTLNSQEEAEASFLRAIEVARRQGARSLELRATMSLCLLRRDQGRAQEARQLLADIYGWFTEGFDSPDLRRANALLEDLQGH
jgi:tetratricopeptide (TPR) repeat protein